MELMAELGVVWLLATAAAAIYQASKRRPLAKAAHLSTIFGLFAVLMYFLAAVFTDVLDLRPERAQAAVTVSAPVSPAG